MSLNNVKFSINQARRIKEAEEAAKIAEMSKQEKLIELAYYVLGAIKEHEEEGATNRWVVDYTKRKIGLLGLDKEESE